jgi:hypothetical protein
MDVAVVDELGLLGVDIPPDGLTPLVGIICFISDPEKWGMADEDIHIRELAELLGCGKIVPLVGTQTPIRGHAAKSPDVPVAVLDEPKVDIGDVFREGFSGVVVPLDRKDGLLEPEVNLFEDGGFHVPARQDKVNPGPDGLFEPGFRIIRYDQNVARIPDH